MEGGERGRGCRVVVDNDAGASNEKKTNCFICTCIDVLSTYIQLDIYLNRIGYMRLHTGGYSFILFCSVLFCSILCCDSVSNFKLTQFIILQCRMFKDVLC